MAHIYIDIYILFIYNDYVGESTDVCNYDS